MAARTERYQLPNGVGHFTPAFWLLAAALAGIVLVGVVAYSRQLIVGEVVTGMRDWGTMGGAPWGLYIVFDSYFAGVGFAALFLALLSHVFEIPQLRPLSRAAGGLAVVSFLLASATVIADLGSPVRGILKLLQYGRPQSPFFGTFSLIAVVSLVAALVYGYLDGRKDAAKLAKQDTPVRWLHRLWAAGYQDTAEEQQRHDRTRKWLALGILPLLLVAHSTLGLVFGLQAGAAGWYTALLAPAFLILAGVSGAAHLVVLAYVARLLLGLQAKLTPATFAWLGNLLGILLAAYLYVLAVMVFSTAYSGNHHEARVSKALLTGDYAWLFWLGVAAFVAAALLVLAQFLRRKYDLSLVLVAALLAIGGTVIQRYLTVLPSQTHGRLLPYEIGSYAPSLVEIGVIVGLLALGALALLLFFRVFPIVELEGSQEA